MGWLNGQKSPTERRRLRTPSIYEKVLNGCGDRFTAAAEKQGNNADYDLDPEMG